MTMNVNVSRPYVASRSFHALCTHKISYPESESQQVPTTYPSQAGESIYVNNTALVNFVNHYLPRIQFPFVMVSGDTDMTIPNDCPGTAQTILQSPLLIAWYSQNCTQTSHPKLKQLPIGLDLHTLTRGNHAWGPSQSVDQQESLVTNLCAHVLISSSRKTMCYSNFHFLMNTRYGYDRHEAVNRVPKNLVYYEPNKVPRLQSWQTMMQYKYVLSPHGNGLDCHRTWEAMLLGCIPIVKTSPLDPMFEGLPILIVKDWSEVSLNLLSTFVPDMSQIEKLTLNYWNRLINRQGDPELSLQRAIQFLNHPPPPPSPKPTSAPQKHKMRIKQLTARVDRGKLKNGGRNISRGNRFASSSLTHRKMTIRRSYMKRQMANQPQSRQQLSTSRLRIRIRTNRRIINRRGLRHKI